MLLTEDCYFSSPVLSSFLPKETLDGTIWSGFSCFCGKCNQQMEDKNIRGVATDAFGVILVEAVGLCGSCLSLSKFRLRVKDGGVTEKINRDGEWVRQSPKIKEEGLLGKLKRVLRNSRRTPRP